MTATSPLTRICRPRKEPDTNALVIAASIGNLSGDKKIKRAALTVGGIFIRSSSRVLNEVLGDGAPGAGPDLNAHFNTTQREYNECKRMIEAHAALVEV